MQYNHYNYHVLAIYFDEYVILVDLTFTGRDTNILIYVKRRLAMCARKLGRNKEAVKMFRDVGIKINFFYTVSKMCYFECC